MHEHDFSTHICILFQLLRLRISDPTAELCFWSPRGDCYPRTPTSCIMHYFPNVVSLWDSLRSSPRLLESGSCWELLSLKPPNLSTPGKNPAGAHIGGKLCNLTLQAVHFGKLKIQSFHQLQYGDFCFPAVFPFSFGCTEWPWNGNSWEFESQNLHCGFFTIVTYNIDVLLNDILNRQYCQFCRFVRWLFWLLHRQLCG